jgi:hypothetical protein
MTPETMPTDEKENLIAATEENVRYWTQRIMDELEEPWTAQRISQVIRELLTADTNESVVTSLRAEVEGLKKLVGHLNEQIDTVKRHRADALFEKEQAINRQAEQMHRADEAEAKLASEQLACSQLYSEKQAALAQLAKRQWVSCAERLPTEADKDKHGNVLIRYEDGGVSMWSGGMWQSDGQPNPKHFWMPIPPTQAPATVEKDCAHTCQLAKTTGVACPPDSCDIDTKARTATVGENRQGELCPSCGAPEVEANTPWTVYACGSKDYDQRPGTFKKGENCKPATVETCPTCGSADKSVRESMSKPNCGPPLFPCRDAWHDKPTPDPLALVKAHHAKGGRVQWQWKDTPMTETWFNGPEGDEWNSNKSYRIAPAPASPPRVEMPKIKTRFIHPPIPIRNFDWEATRDGYDKDDPIGFGRTEELVKADLLEQEEAR